MLHLHCMIYDIQVKDLHSKPYLSKIMYSPFLKIIFIILPLYMATMDLKLSNQDAIKCSRKIIRKVIRVNK